MTPERQATLKKSLQFLPTHIIQETEIKFPKYIEFEDQNSPVGYMCECGGKIQKVSSVLKSTLPKPRNKRKRILKKMLKVWEKEVSKLRLKSRTLSYNQTPKFICDSCELSGYQLAAQNSTPILEYTTP